MSETTDWFVIDTEDQKLRELYHMEENWRSISLRAESYRVVADTPKLKIWQHKDVEQWKDLVIFYIHKDLLA